MIIKKQKPQMEISTNVKSVEFDITDEHKATILGYLRKNIYSDYQLAVVREYLSNAIDANRENDKPTSDIIITVPSYSDTNFCIEDQGKGLSEDEVMNLLVYYGKSTKNDSNSNIGGFGVGFKAAFCYYNSFLVTSVKNGKEITVLCSKNTKDGDNIGAGSCSIISEIETSKPTGTKIIIPAAYDNKSDIERCISYILRYWKPEDRPSILNMRADDIPNYSNLEYGFNFIENNKYHYQRMVTAVIGGIPYKCGFLLDDSKYYKIFDKDCIIKLDIGDVDIPISRESINNNNKTHDCLKSIIVKNVDEHFDKHINSKSISEINDNFDDNRIFFNKYENFIEDYRIAILKDKFNSCENPLDKLLFGSIISDCHDIKSDITGANYYHQTDGDVRIYSRTNGELSITSTNNEFIFKTKNFKIKDGIGVMWENVNKFPKDAKYIDCRSRSFNSIDYKKFPDGKYVLIRYWRNRKASTDGVKNSSIRESLNRFFNGMFDAKSFLTKDTSSSAKHDPVYLKCDNTNIYSSGSKVNKQLRIDEISLYRYIVMKNDSVDIEYYKELLPELQLETTDIYLSRYCNSCTLYDGLLCFIHNNKNGRIIFADKSKIDDICEEYNDGEELEDFVEYCYNNIKMYKKKALNKIKDFIDSLSFYRYDLFTTYVSSDEQLTKIINKTIGSIYHEMLSNIRTYTSLSGITAIPEISVEIQKIKETLFSKIKNKYNELNNDSKDEQ